MRALFMHVHAVDAQCATDYRGRTLLERSPTVIALPTDRASDLVVTFGTSSSLPRREVGACRPG